ncbi:MAG: PEP-CTERM sorting domain-containing protein [Candidatus Pacebacteria bacterium]|nr:PEP-CTERM sorting domain-containing protein [Candidatus Paceibacterota bacterium]
MMSQRFVSAVLIGAVLTVIGSTSLWGGYIYPVTWDYVTDFSTTVNQVPDSEGNVTWEYRGGWFNYAPSDFLLMPQYSSTLHAWYSPDHKWGNATWGQVGKSEEGKGFVIASEPGANYNRPMINWVSPVNRCVNIDLSVLDTGSHGTTGDPNQDLYLRTDIYVNDSWVHTFSRDGEFQLPLAVVKDDVVHVRFSYRNVPSDLTGHYAWSNDLNFTVTTIPEPATLSLLFLGGCTVLCRRRRASLPKG